LRGDRRKGKVRGVTDAFGGYCGQLTRQVADACRTPGSVLGLGRVKTLTREVGRDNQSGDVSGRDRGNQWLDANDVHDPCQIVGQDGKCHLYGHFWKRLG
jgi:hypothetical protein